MHRKQITKESHNAENVGEIKNDIGMALELNLHFFPPFSKNYADCVGLKKDDGKGLKIEVIQQR